jgi:diaminopimelate decarboxylase
MDHFKYQNGTLCCEQVPVQEVAEAHGTPAFVYSGQTLRDHLQRLRAAFAAVDPLICYSVKSCGNIHICRLLAEEGAGMDVVSGGELYRVQQAEAPMDRVVYAGVGKTRPEIEAALDAGIGCFNVESEAEFEAISALAREKGATAQAALRLNPDVDPRTHAKTTTGKKETKFGVDLERARRFFETYGNDPHVKLTGLHVHIGSPIYSTDPYVDALQKATALAEELTQQGHIISLINIGGGFGADYEQEQSPAYEDYAAKLLPMLKPFYEAGGRVALEPGRTIAANSGVLLTRVQYVKQSGQRTFAVVDSGMHHLLRPTLYDAFHFVWPASVPAAQAPARRAPDPGVSGLSPYEVVGPICETGDYLAKERPLPPLQAEDLLAVVGAGAYGMAMASNYNAMPRPPEVLIEGDRPRLIRRRETYEQMVAPEWVETPVAAH